jgi:ribosomal protein S18 acetylase RimI-like enzyme
MRRELAGGFELDDDRERIDIDAVHAFISGESYWGLGRARERVVQAVAGSQRVLGLYHEGAQIGFARAVSDGVTLAYLADVYVLGDYRGRGLGLELVREIVENSFGEVRWMLNTADAQGLYERLGFSEEKPPYPLMERAPRRAASVEPRR